jgi:hypothetical protein
LNLVVEKSQLLDRGTGLSDVPLENFNNFSARSFEIAAGNLATHSLTGYLNSTGCEKCFVTVIAKISFASAQDLDKPHYLKNSVPLCPINIESGKAQTEYMINILLGSKLLLLWLMLLFAAIFLTIWDLLPTILSATLLSVLPPTSFVSVETLPATLSIAKFTTAPFAIVPMLFP